ncbi:hypothetical protein Q7A53_17775 [Halobacillus rhizosphaerae]|uniref:hypothetical protein n=1 Tax=Halobacillus rhizosphaerae TaxID=3064889 RepID=UPI00398A9BD4
MWSTISIIFIAAAIFFSEIPKLKKNNKIKEIWYVSTLLFLSTAAAVLESRGYQLINPLDYIEAFYSMILPG